MIKKDRYETSGTRCRMCIPRLQMPARSRNVDLNPLNGKDEISRAENLSFYTPRWVPRSAATNARLCNNLSKCPVKRF